MNLADAYYLVFKDLTKDEGSFTGVYDAKYGNPNVMYGIGFVMQQIAYKVSEDCGDAFYDRFFENMVKSEREARKDE